MLKKYRVIGGRSILQNPPGSEFEADLKGDQEARLLALGHIEIVEVESEEDGTASEDYDTTE